MTVGACPGLCPGIPLPPLPPVVTGHGRQASRSPEAPRHPSGVGAAPTASPGLPVGAKARPLTNSIKESGIKEPPIVRPLQDGTFQIASGHRRWLAAQKAGLKEIRCWIQALTDEEVARDNIALNIQREDLPPLEMARMVDNYISQFDKSQQEA